MTVDYKQLKRFVIEELAVDGPGGMMAPSAPKDIPHRMPAADGWDKEQDQGDPEANELYDVAMAAREAAETLVEALDDPIFDKAYEHAFKASASLRRVLNELEESGAHPMPQQRVVAPPPNQQKYNAGYRTYKGPGGAGVFGAKIPGIALSDLGEVKMEVGALQGKMKQMITLYNTLPVKDKQAFQAFILGGATAD